MSELNLDEVVCLLSLLSSSSDAEQRLVELVRLRAERQHDSDFRLFCRGRQQGGTAPAAAAALALSNCHAAIGFSCCRAAKQQGAAAWQKCNGTIRLQVLLTRDATDQVQFRSITFGFEDRRNNNGLLIFVRANI